MATETETNVWVVGETPEREKILSTSNVANDEAEVWRESDPETKVTLLQMDTDAGEGVIGWYAEPEPYVADPAEDAAIPAEEPVEGEVAEEPSADEDEDVEETPDEAVAAAVSSEVLEVIEGQLEGYESLVTELLMAQMEDERYADDADEATPERPAPSAQTARVAAVAREFLDSINAAVTAAASKPEDEDEDESEDDKIAKRLEADRQATEEASGNSVTDEKNAALKRKRDAEKREVSEDEDAEVAAMDEEDSTVPNEEAAAVAEEGVAPDEEDSGEEDAEDADERLASIRDRMGKLEEAITRLMSMGQEDAEIDDEPDVSDADSTVDERDPGSM